jgi:hypothetical protein
MMLIPARLISRYPRLAAALVFGALASIATHFAWYSQYRFGESALSIGAGLAYAAAGLLTGERLVDRARTRSDAQAARLGAVTGLIATAFFGFGMTVAISVGDAGPFGIWKFATTAVLTSVFAFLGAGWALLVLAVAAAVGLHRGAARIVPLSASAGPVDDQ